MVLFSKRSSKVSKTEFDHKEVAMPACGQIAKVLDGVRSVILLNVPVQDENFGSV